MSGRTFFVALATFLLYSVEHVTAGSTNGTLVTPALTAFVETQLSPQYGGLSIAVVSAGSTPNSSLVEYGSWGFKSETGDAVVPETLFQVGSSSKAFLSASISILIDDFANGRNSTPLPPSLVSLSWNTKLRDLLPGEWKMEDHWASEKASLRDILAHNSGLPRHDLMYGPSDSPQNVTGRVRHLRPTNELREQFSYDNIMYMVAARVIEIYSGQTFTTFASKRVFKPIGMNSSTYLPSVATASDLTQCFTSWGRRLPLLYNDSSAELIAGPGGVFTNAVDMGKWAAMLLSLGVDPTSNDTIIPADSFAQITSGQFIAFPTGAATMEPNMSLEGYGAGWYRGSYKGHEIVMHDGSVPGFTSLQSFVPDLGLAIVSLGNVDNLDSATLDVTLKIIDGVLSTESESPDAGSLSSRHLPSRVLAKRGDAPVAPAFSLETYAGDYTNDGYGMISLCAPTSNSSYCSSVNADFAAVDAHADDHGSASSPGAELLTAFPKLLASHIRFVPSPNISGTPEAVGRNLSMAFGFRPTFLFPQGFGANSTAFENPMEGITNDSDLMLVEFVEEDGEIAGFGIFSFIDGGEDGGAMHAPGASVQDSAYAWFAKS